MNPEAMKKKDPASLRPLTEKEIQEKLYGNYHQNRTPLTEDFEEKIAAGPLRPKTRPVVMSPNLVPKVSIRIPWRALGRFLVKAMALVWSFFKALIRRLSTAWGAGLVIVVGLFLGIHALNIYRGHAMKQSKSRVRAVQPKAVTTPPLTPPSAVPVPVKTEIPLKPPTTEAKPVPPRPVPLKPYVIQVATYSREEDAQKLAKEIQEQEGLSAFTQALSGQSGRVFHAVFLGRFRTFPEAQAKLKEFRENSLGRQFSDSFVRSLN